MSQSWARVEGGCNKGFAALAAGLAERCSSLIMCCLLAKAARHRPQQSGSCRLTAFPGDRRCEEKHRPQNGSAGCSATSCFVFPRLSPRSCRWGPATPLQQPEALPTPDRALLSMGSFRKEEPQERARRRDARRCACTSVNARPTSVFSSARVALQGEDGCVWRGCASGTARCCCVLPTGVSTHACVCVCTSWARAGVHVFPCALRGADACTPQFKSRYGCCRAHAVRGYIRGALRTRTDRALRRRTGAAYRDA